MLLTKAIKLKKDDTPNIVTELLAKWGRLTPLERIACIDEAIALTESGKEPGTIKMWHALKWEEPDPVDHKQKLEDFLTKPEPVERIESRYVKVWRWRITFSRKVKG